MTTALIGHTGFVGGNLARQISFDACFHSKNIGEIRGQTFDTVVCAGVPAVKWLANREPDHDLKGILPLLIALEGVKAARFILISTIDVYRDPVGVDEATPISTDGLHPYGTHRRLVETFVQERFATHHVVRLPGLFGDGLKKNVIYDFLHRNQMENIHADAVFQFYPLDRLASDLRIVVDSGLPVVNFATEPVAVREVADHAFGTTFSNRPSNPPPRYDMRTRHADIFGGAGPYLASRGEVLEQIGAFVRRQRGEEGA
jgi:nucleoside-diphosphate-sugar epimerase